jgi:hypothetical protein
MIPVLGRVRSLIINGSEVALTALLYWQAADAPRPVTVVATGLVLAIRKAALLSLGNSTDAADR